MVRKKYLTYFLCLIPVLVFTIANRYPILYSDTSTYLASGFELETPADRPITYGLLLRIFSLNGLSLFFVPIFQALMFLFVLKEFLQLFITENRIPALTLLLSVVIGLTSGYYWCVNQLIPDFLSALGFLSLLTISFSVKDRSKQTLNYFIFFIAAAAHISNVFIYFLITTILFVILIKTGPISFQKLKIKFAVIYLLLGLSYIIMSSAISKSKDVFYCGSLAEKGILQQILKDKCSDQRFKLCDYKDSIPGSFDYFVWNDKSPLYTLGGWKALRPELNAIASVSRSESKYIQTQISKTFSLFLKQFLMIETAEGNGPFGNQTPLGKRIAKYIKLDDKCFDKSLQSQSFYTHTKKINVWYNIVAIVNFFCFLLLLIIGFKRLSTKLKIFILSTLVLIMSTALLVAYSSVISHRHGVKLFWLIVLANFLIVYELFLKKQLDQQNIVHKKK